jgi:Flp pilus assembly protein TadG
VTDALTVDELERPNLNRVLIAGTVGGVSRDKGLVRFTLSYTKHWPDGGTSTIAIPVVAKPQEWLKPGMTVLIKGELQRRAMRGTPAEDVALEVYGYQVESLEYLRKGAKR